jgi:hypothetical protein
LLELFREGYVADAWFQSKDNEKTTWLGWSIRMKMVCGIWITVWLCLLVRLVKEFWRKLTEASQASCES